MPVIVTLDSGLEESGFTIEVDKQIQGSMIRRERDIPKSVLTIHTVCNT